MALNVFKTPIGEHPTGTIYSPTAAGGCTMSKGTSKFKAANGISQKILLPGVPWDYLGNPCFTCLIGIPTDG